MIASTMDLSTDKDPGSIDPSARDGSDSVSASDSGIAGGQPKSCADCRTTKTPLWRGGPNGPKSLCNACGIRYRKKRREAKGMMDGLGMKMKVLGMKKKWKQRMLGEEEQAAVLLMALSSGLFCA